MGTYDTRGGAPLHDPAADHEGACELCGFAAADCICPTCPICGTQGDKNCVANHGLRLTYHEFMERVHSDVCHICLKPKDHPDHQKNP